jgi:hypothetical protein
MRRHYIELKRGAEYARLWTGVEMGRHATFARQICTGQSATADGPRVRKPGFQVKVKRAKNGLKEQGEKCRNADFLHEVELLPKHNTKVAAVRPRNLQTSGWDES